MVAGFEPNNPNPLIKDEKNPGFCGTAVEGANSGVLVLAGGMAFLDTWQGGHLGEFVGLSGIDFFELGKVFTPGTGKDAITSTFAKRKVSQRQGLSPLFHGPATPAIRR